MFKISSNWIRPKFVCFSQLVVLDSNSDISNSLRRDVFTEPSVRVKCQNNWRQIAGRRNVFDASNVC